MNLKKRYGSNFDFTLLFLIHLLKICGDFDEYVINLAAPKGWGTVVELEVISRMFR